MTIIKRQHKLPYLLTATLLATVFFFKIVNAQPASSGDSNIHLADPALFYNKGVYYLYGTVEGSANNGFIAYTSADRLHWQKDTSNTSGYALSKGGAFGNANFWAPQVFKNGNQFYMAYTADENIAIAQSSSPAGPFTQKVLQPLAAPIKQIDPFVFFDDDGRKYLYHVRLTNGNSIFVAELEDDLSAIKPSTLKECITATEPWENTAKVPWPVAEGPSILKHKNLYYLFYTANDFRNPDYAVGYATSNNPLGPWKKYGGNPVISREILGVNGTGHGDFLKLPSGDLQYIFHTHFSDKRVAPRRTIIIKARFMKSDAGVDKLVIDKTSFHFPLSAQHDHKL